MKLRVTVDGRTFEVDVLDASARPVVAIVDGERFEVLPEGGGPTPTSAGRAAPGANGVTPSSSVAAPAAPTGPASRNAVLAPIPGVIVSLAVQAGQRVTAGQEVCVLEAMKMQNSLRAPRDGVIATVRVAPGQAVRHRETLLEYAP